MITSRRVRPLWCVTLSLSLALSCSLALSLTLSLSIYLSLSQIQTANGSTPLQGVQIHLESGSYEGWERDFVIGVQIPLLIVMKRNADTNGER